MKLNFSKASRLVLVFLMFLATLVVPFSLSGSAVAKAQERERMMREGPFMGERHVMVRTDRDFFFRHGVFSRHPIFFRNFPRFVEPQDILIIDRDDFSQRFFLNNFFTGPSSLSVNRVVIVVNDSVFQTIRNDVDINQNFSVNVDTGNNVVSFNTLVGNITTGDVSISIQ